MDTIADKKAKLEVHKADLLDLQKELQLNGESPELKAKVEAKLTTLLNEFGNIDFSKIVR